MTGTVVFSLDFELGWGHANVRPEYVSRLRSDSGENFDRIRSLVDLFDEYEVPATWAVVGKLTETGDDPLFHNPDLFEYLLDADVEHDVGLHSYEHQSFADLSETDARADLRSGVDALQRWDVRPRSFIYPRGQINHVQLLAEYGFESYRSRRHTSKIGSLKRLIVPPVTDYPTATGQLASIPGTMFLAARRPLWYRKWTVSRAIEQAATDGGLVHLWWHPHNVISQPAMVDLIEEIVAQVREFCKSDHLRCVPMSGLTG